MSAVAREPIGALLWKRWRDPAAWITTSDIFIILIVLSLPWSTSLVAIFAVAALVTMLPFLDVKAFLQVAETPDLHGADRALCAGGRRDAVVGRAVGRAAICGRPGRKTADAAGAVLSFRTLVARPAGVRGLSDLLCPAAGDVLDRGVRSGARAEIRRRVRRAGQKLYRPESGIRTVRRGAGLSGHQTAARRANCSGLVARRDRAELHRSTWRSSSFRARRW